MHLRSILSLFFIASLVSSEILLYKDISWKTQEKILKTLEELAASKGLKLYESPQGHCLSFRGELAQKTEQFLQKVNKYRTKKEGLLGYVLSIFPEDLSELKLAHLAVRAQILGYETMETNRWSPEFAKRMAIEEVKLENFEDWNPESDSESHPIQHSETDPVHYPIDRFDYEAQMMPSLYEPLHRAEIRSPPKKQEIESLALLDRVAKAVDSEKSLKYYEMPGHPLNFKALGYYFARMLVWDEFGCYDVPNLSLLIFRLFSLRAIPLAGVKPFFSGFFIYLTDLAEKKTGIQLGELSGY
jgi:hypothetical protein